MKKVVRLTEEAERDIFHCVKYIANDNEEAAIRVYASFKETTAQILNLPKMGREQNFGHGDLMGLREIPLIGFKNFLVFYRENDEGIIVIRLLHKSRNVPALFSGMTDER